MQVLGLLADMKRSEVQRNEISSSASKSVQFLLLILRSAATPKPLAGLRLWIRVHALKVWRGTRPD